MPSPSAIKNAVIAKLGSDAALLALLPNGVYEAVGPPGFTRFATVSQVAGHNTYELNGRIAYTELLLAIEARVLSTSGGNVQAAADRIDALLNPTPGMATLTAPGYTLMDLTCEDPISEVEQDGADPSISWKRRGGLYRVQMAPVYN